MKTRKPTRPTITYNPEHTPEERSRDRYRWIEHASDGLRVVGTAHDIARGEGCWRTIDHTGWWMDPLGDGETVCGAVLQLPARGGQPQYVPTVQDPCNPDCYLADFHSITDDKMDAARWADGMAERYAEAEREDRTRDMAEQRAADLREEARELRAQHRALLAEMRAARARDVFGSPWPVICGRLRADLAAMRARVRAALERAARLDDEPFSILEG